MEILTVSVHYDGVWLDTVYESTPKAVVAGLVPPTYGRIRDMVYENQETYFLAVLERQVRQATEKVQKHIEDMRETIIKRQDEGEPALYPARTPDTVGTNGDG